MLATVCGNQANVALMQHRHDQALALAERSVELQEQSGTPHGLGVALASLGQICVRLGNLKRAEEALNRALDVRSPLQFMRETTGAVFDTLAQIHLIRGEHDEAEPCAAEGARRRTASTARRRAAGISGRCACSKRGSRCGAGRSRRALAIASDIARSDGRSGRLRDAGGADRDRSAARLRLRTTKRRSGSRASPSACSRAP